MSRLVWVGHATALIEVGGARLLTDPLLRSRLAHLRRHGPPPAPEAMRDLDAVLISHLHHDHLDLPSLRLLPAGTPLVVPRGAAVMLHRHGFADVRELAAGESTEVAGVEVLAVEAVHDRHRLRIGLHADTLGYVVGGTVYFAGDTDLFDGMADLAGIEVALIPVWGWGPSLGHGHLDPEAAARAAALLQPRIAVPIHWGTFFPVGLEALRGSALIEPPRVFARHVAELAPEVEVRVLAPGDELVLGTVAS